MEKQLRIDIGCKFELVWNDEQDMYEVEMEGRVLGIVRKGQLFPYRNVRSEDARVAQALINAWKE